MTTTVPNFYAADRRTPLSLVIQEDGGEHLHIEIHRGDQREQINVDPAVFLDAVGSELGVLAIAKADLPEVKHFADGRVYAETDNGFGDYTLDKKDTPERLIGHARALLALAAHLEAHPPVDEQQVEALTEALIEAGLREKVVPAMVARRLVEFGYRIERA